MSSAPCNKFVVNQPDRECSDKCTGVYLCPCGTQHSRDGSAYATSTACDDAHGRFHCTNEHCSKHCRELQGHAETARRRVREEVDRNTCSLCRRLLSLDSGSTNDVQRPCQTYGCLQQPLLWAIAHSLPTLSVQAADPACKGIRSTVRRWLLPFNNDAFHVN